MSRRTARPELTPDQQAEAERIRHALLDAAAADIRELAELLATTDDAHTFGATEFAVRDIVHRIGAKAVETALEGRKKGGTTGRAGTARRAASPPGSSGGGASRS
jgi:hypothetical protein